MCQSCVLFLSFISDYMTGSSLVQMRNVKHVQKLQLADISLAEYNPFLDLTTAGSGNSSVEVAAVCSSRRLSIMCSTLQCRTSTSCSINNSSKLVSAVVIGAIVLILVFKATIKQSI